MSGNYIDVVVRLQADKYFDLEPYVKRLLQRDDWVDKAPVGARAADYVRINARVISVGRQTILTEDHKDVDSLEVAQGEPPDRVDRRRVLRPMR